MKLKPEEEDESLTVFMAGSASGSGQGLPGTDYPNLPLYGPQSL
jgi:hypothetical protein